MTEQVKRIGSGLGQNCSKFVCQFIEVRGDQFLFVVIYPELEFDRF